MMIMASIAKRPRNKTKPYAVRYRDPSGRQRETSFRTYREAQHYRAEVEHSTGNGTYQDPQLASASFTEYASHVVDSMAISDGSRKLYRGMVRTWLAPWAGTRTLAQVANDRDGATNLLNRDMRSDAGLLSYNRRGIARAILLAVLNEAVASGKLYSHRLNGIKLVRDDKMPTHDDFVFPSYQQIRNLAEGLNGYGIAVWLMRGCGLRIREALGVHREDFRAKGTVLRVSRQASLDGTHAVPLKHRRPGQYRDGSRPRSGVNKKTGVGSLQDRQVIEGKDLRPCHTEYPLPSASAATSTSCSLRTRDFRRSWKTSPASARSC